MKNISTLLLLLIFSMTVSAQVFWTENFGSGCNLGQLASAYTGVNGTWTVASTGTNESDGNLWFINSRVINTGVGNCGIGDDQACSGTPNPNLHVGGCAFALIGIPADSASYWTGYYCSLLSFCNETNLQAQSPVINCSAESNITMAFTYYYGGDLTKSGANGCATIMYNDGSGWVLLDSINKTTRCSGTTFGVWTAYSISLPASANHNSTVQIGVNWSNNDASTGTDPSFAVDDITLSGSGSSALPPVAGILTQGDSSACSPVCLNVTDNSTNTPTSWLWTFTGASTTTSTAQNPGVICWDSSGTFSIKLKVSNSAGSDSATLSNYVTVDVTPSTPTITFSGDTLYASYDPLATSYQWSDSSAIIMGATKSYLVISHSGNYNVSVGNSDGCKIATGITVTYVGMQIYSLNNQVTMFPSPAKDELTISGNWQLSSGMLSVFDMLGKKVMEEFVNLDDHVIINVKDLPNSIYFIEIANDKGRWIGKFVKD